MGTKLAQARLKASGFGNNNGAKLKLQLKFLEFFKTMRHQFRRFLFLSGLITMASAAHAGVFFVDDFSANTPSLDNPVPLGWSIGNAGSIDILGTCGSSSLDDVLIGNNCYIDLDGGSPVNGLLTKSLPLVTGHSYIASFQLAGNQFVPFGDSVTVTFGTSETTEFIAPFDDFQTFDLTFTPTVSGIYDLSFINSNVDDSGAVLDNIFISQVPAPLPLLGAGVAFGFSRNLRSRIHGRKP